MVYNVSFSYLEMKSIKTVFKDVYFYILYYVVAYYIFNSMKQIWSFNGCNVVECVHIPIGYFHIWLAIGGYTVLPSCYVSITKISSVGWLFTIFPARWVLCFSPYSQLDGYFAFHHIPS